MSLHYKIIVGLGNPGKQYQQTRHNIGFLLVDQLQGRYASPGVAAWREKFGAEIAEVAVKGEKLLLAKPMSYMNLSGEPVSRIMGFFKFYPGDLLVVHDDVDLSFGVCRIKKGSGHGGHNGVRSISEYLGTNEYVRLKLGVGRPRLPEEEEETYQRSLSDWVLGRFSAAELGKLKEVLDRGLEAVVSLCEEGVRAAQTRFNRDPSLP